MTHPPRRIGRLHVVTDTTVQKRYTHEEIAALAVAGGARDIQLRDKRMHDEELVATARRTLALCADAGAVLIVNDRVEVARVARAHGVHLGRADTPIAEARALLGPSVIIGATAGTLTQALEAQAAGADYVGFGHIFPTASKHKSTPPVGLEGLREVCAALRIPVIAIGGITADNAADVLAAGAWGVAVIGAVCAAPDPEAAARALARATEA
ncbi:MAG: thiamine phosphate synthase [Candidatus Krumholzibacteria bacterium]|nr:thiamine phosphate synthase [Candidatus Krumholzibacteria bacterium]